MVEDGDLASGIGREASDSEPTSEQAIVEETHENGTAHAQPELRGNPGREAQSHASISKPGPEEPHALSIHIVSNIYGTQWVIG